MIPGFARKKKRPEPPGEPKKPPVRCPRCNAVADKYPRSDVEDQLGLDPDEVTLYLCEKCEFMAAHVEGIEDIWRPVRADHAEEDLEQIVEDAHQGLRHRHFLTADPSDPMFGSGG